MPFKLRLKKSRQYNVVSKSLFVCGVELLDGGSLECTLESESTGRDCLDNVCQRLGLNQPEYFGLQYLPRCTGPNNNPRWLEMDRPVKRQLDKYASGPQLLLRVMFYITCPVSNLLTDETSRYHYFLQLKMDVIEGRIATTPQQAVVLASYSMQAEFGNYDAERHTLEYLKDFQLFPRHLTESEVDIIERLAEAATHQHAALRGLPSGNAEERYISACQQLEGYGQEKFIARDDQAQIVEIGISLNGILVLCEMTGEKKFYMWRDISNVINHKKYFTIECTNSNDTVQYQFNDIESAKHVWRMCAHQHTFHTKLQMMIESNPSGGNQNLNPVFNTTFESVHSSHEKIQATPQEYPQRAQSTSCLDLTTDIERLRALLPSYRAAPDYETAIQQKYQPQPLYSSQPEIRKYPDVTHMANLVERMMHLYKPPPPYPHRLCSNSVPDLASQRYMMPLYGHGSSPDLVSTKTLLNRVYLKQQYLQAAHGTYENLASFGEFGPAVIMENRDVTKHVQKIIDEHGNVIYCMPALLENQTYPTAAPRTSGTLNYLTKSSTTEPIYENIPLPWQDNELIRERTESIQSAPETLASIRNQVTYVNIPPRPTEPEPPKPVEPLAPPSNGIPLNNNTETSAINDIFSRIDSRTYRIKENYQPNQSSSSSYQPNSTISSMDTTHSSASTASKEKKRRRWGLLVGKKTEKSATLGREKSNVSSELKSDGKERHRWSTGLPRFQPLPPTINKETMCQILEHKLSDSQLFFEFEKIAKKKPNADFTTALLPENTLRNRFKDVLPYEENRVRLTPTKENKFGYINASHITATVGNKQRFYIAAQGPTRQTLEDFWNAVWQADVYLIVQLTDSQEDLNYIPHEDQRNVTIGQYQIWSEYQQSSGNCSTSKLRVCNSQSRHYRSVWHMMYGLWGEQGCPAGGIGTPGGPQAHFLAFLEELRSVREHSVAQDIPPGHNRNPPTLVHCTAGVGRTGVAILCDLLLYTLDHNQEMDIARTVGLLRHQRAHMVQTVAQYRFVYSLLIYYLKQTRLI